MSSRPEPPALLEGVVASVAHELNNQLAILMGRAELMAEDLAAQPALADDLRVIREAAAHSHRAAQTLVGLVRPRARPASRVGFNEVAQTAAAMLAYTLRSAGMALELVPDPAQPWTTADEGLVLRPVLALLHLAQREARAHAPCGLRLSVASESGAVAFTVSGPIPVLAPADLAALGALAEGAAAHACAGAVTLRFPCG